LQFWHLIPLKSGRQVLFSRQRTGVKTRIASVTSAEHLNLNAKEDCEVFEGGRTATHSFFFHLNAQLRSKAGQSLTT